MKKTRDKIDSTMKSILFHHSWISHLCDFLTAGMEGPAIKLSLIGRLRKEPYLALPSGFLSDEKARILIRIKIKKNLTKTLLLLVSCITKGINQLVILLFDSRNRTRNFSRRFCNLHTIEKVLSIETASYAHQAEYGGKTAEKNP